jgi:hypothetical protein
MKPKFQDSQKFKLLVKETTASPWAMGATGQ